MDFETFSTIDLISAGLHLYARSTNTEILCVGYRIDDGPIAVISPQEMPEVLNSLDLASTEVVAHNAAFEYAIWKQVASTRYGWPLPILSNFNCTMARAYAVGFPGSLQNAAAAAGLDTGKDMAGKRIMMELSKPKRDGSRVTDADKMQRLREYCAKDVEVECKLDERLPELSVWERELWLLDQIINQRGVQIDTQAVLEAYRILLLEKDRLNDEICNVTGGFVKTATQYGAIRQHLEKRFGFDVPSVDKEATEKFIEFCEANPGKYEDVRSMLELKKQAGKASTAKLKAMLLSVSSDDRLRGLFQYHGANTGRWAGRRVQVHNLPRHRLSMEEIEWIFQILKK